MNATSILCFLFVATTPPINSWTFALAASAITFAVTNIDDLILLTALFASGVPLRRVASGQYLGFAAIVLVSLLGVWAAFSVSHRWIQVLGVLPILIALKQLAKLHREGSGGRRIKDVSVASISIATFANGADNIAVYVPFFIVARKYMGLTLAAYMTLVAVWCLIARAVGSHPFILERVGQFGHWIVPFVMIVLGVYVMTN